MIKRINNYNPQSDGKSRCNVSFGARRILPQMAQAFRHNIFNAQRLALLCHKNPDHDTYYAARAVAHLAESHGKKAGIWIDRKDLKHLILPSDKSPMRNLESPDLILALDHNGTDRMSEESLRLLEQNPSLAIIDHHRETPHNLKNALTYIDDSSRSCCGIVYRWFEVMGEKINPEISKLLTIGALSDLKKSRLVEFKNSQILRLPALAQDSPSREILDSLESQLSAVDMNEIGHHLDVLSNLTPTERAFQQQLFSAVQTTPNGKLAYVIIDPADEQWRGLGYKNERTAEILRDTRRKLISNAQNDNGFTSGQKIGLANVKEAAIFYPVDGGRTYRISIHGEHALDMLGYAKRIYQRKVGHEFIGDGHPTRAGGKINSCAPEEVGHLIHSFVEAAETAN